MQEVIKGQNSLLQLATILQKRGTKDILFVTGLHLLKDPVFHQLQASLSIPYQVVHPPEGLLQTTSTPNFDLPGTVVAIGGGKVIDFAKGMIYQHRKPVFFVATPTTAGSGSEATPIAVFYNGDEKISLDAPSLLPSLVILDDTLLSGLPAIQRAISGADALAQCIESAWNKNSTPLSESFAIEGMQILWQALPEFVKAADKDVDEKVLWAAHLGGKAIALTRTTGPHALSYFLTARYSVPHGQAVALTLPLFFLYNGEGEAGNLQKIFSVLQVSNSDDAATACRGFLKDLGLATTLAELGLTDLDIDQWLSSVNHQRFDNNPVPFDREKLKALFLRYLR